MPSIKDALTYTVQNGLRPPLPILPIFPHRKTPLIDGGFHEATADPAWIHAWWKKWPDANIGMWTKGFVVLDIDHHTEDADGADSLRELEQEYGELPETWIVLTPTGGAHYYFRCDDPALTVGTAIAPGIDFRAAGGYVLLPPSIHPNGGQYEWDAGHMPHETPLADLPEWLHQLILRKMEKRPFSLATSEIPERIPVGERNNALFKIACSLRAKNLTVEEILPSMRLINRRCDVPLEEPELLTLCKSTERYKRGPSNDNSEDRNQTYKRGRKIKPQLTIDTLEQWLDDNGISLRRNVITHDIKVEGVPSVYDPEDINSKLGVIIHDQVKQQFSCNVNQIGDLLGVIAGKHRYNPVLDMLAEAPTWDGIDRISETYEILHVSEDDTLSRSLIRKWYMQTVAIAGNELGPIAFGADGILVLQGPQGIGKTSFCRKIAVRPEFWKLGLYVDSRDKDTTRRATSCWIGELGEIETTLRSDLERLKAFITAEVDEYRLPYGRADVKLARRTSFIATCNSARFLIDPSGSRRFWTVPITHIDLDALANLDALQLWKQVEVLVKENPQGFRLTQIEQAELARRNGIHEKYLKGQAEIEDILADADRNPLGYTWSLMTVSSFKERHDILRPYSAEQIGKALDKIGIKSENQRVNGKVSRVRKLPAKKQWDAYRTA
ncbi:MAG: bifunctional DNA primase/polymerase [Oscillospiraceae bacterium]|nr:bifunctional DNA primase/polymerase [Oscillospiraceae bacterium]